MSHPAIPHPAEPRSVSEDHCRLRSAVDDSLPPELRFVAGQYHRLPDWTHFYASLGAFLAIDKEPASRIVIGLAIPVRTFSTTFCALGLVLTRSQQGQQNTDIPAAHFEFLLGLPSDTPVTYLRKGRKLQGKLKPRPRTQEIGIQVDNKQSGGRTIYIRNPKQALRITVLENRELRLPNHQQGRQIQADTSFIEAFAPCGNAAVYLSRPSFDLLAVGRINQLKSELCDMKFAIGNATGCLQDVLRARRFVRTGEPYRAEICTSTGHNMPELPDGKTPHTVIYDGGRGFLKWRSQMQGSHQVVMLERSDSEFDDAVNLLMQQSMCRLGDVDLSALPDPPAGVELIAYRVRA